MDCGAPRGEGQCLEVLFHAECENYELGKLSLARNQPRKVLIGKKTPKNNKKELLMA